MRSTRTFALATRSSARRMPHPLARIQSGSRTSRCNRRTSLPWSIRESSATSRGGSARKSRCRRIRELRCLGRVGTAHRFAQLISKWWVVPTLQLLHEKILVVAVRIPIADETDLAVAEPLVKVRGLVAHRVDEDRRAPARGRFGFGHYHQALADLHPPEIFAHDEDIDLHPL